MTNIIVGNSISTEKKRIIYIILVIIFLAAVFSFLYFLFIVITAKNNILILGDKASGWLWLVISSIGAILGIPVGKSWWHTVYEKRGKGLVLKTNTLHKNKRRNKK